DAGDAQGQGLPFVREQGCSHEAEGARMNARRIDIGMICLFVLCETIAVFAVYQCAVSNSTHVVVQKASHASILDSVTWRWDPAANEALTNTYRPPDSEGDTLEFCKN